MAKKTRSTSRMEVAEVPNPMAVAEPPAGDLPDTAHDDAEEPGMPEAAKEVPGTSQEARPTEAAPQTEDKSSSTDDKPEETDEPNAADTDKDDGLPEGLPEDDSQVSIPEEVEKSLEHDTQELEDSDEVLLEEIPGRIEEVQEQDLKRPAEEAPGNDEVSAAKKVVSEVGTDVPVQTVRCEE